MHSERRPPVLPDAPTAKEAVIDHLETSTGEVLLAAGRTPHDIVNRWNAEWFKIAAVPDTRDKMQKIGFEPLSSTLESFAEFIGKEMTRYGRVIREAYLSSEYEGSYIPPITWPLPLSTPCIGLQP